MDVITCPLDSSQAILVKGATEYIGHRAYVTRRGLVTVGDTDIGQRWLK